MEFPKYSESSQGTLIYEIFFSDFFLLYLDFLFLISGWIIRNWKIKQFSNFKEIFSGNFSSLWPSWKFQNDFSFPYDTLTYLFVSCFFCVFFFFSFIMHTEPRKSKLTAFFSIYLAYLVVLLFRVVFVCLIKGASL